MDEVTSDYLSLYATLDVTPRSTDVPSFSHAR
jgi:hypothetical protein